jgi:ParB-like chromosome segregation protein Spo0J
MHTQAMYTTSKLSDLGEDLGRLRLCDPGAEQRMERSLAIHGQLTPLLVRERGHGYEVLDGFKRLHGARALSWEELQVAVVRVNETQAKLKLVHSNRSGALTAIEEAWIVRALHREDGLSQPEIGRLMAHDKSWVSRRLLLAEALGDELQADLRLGLVDATTGRELARLPRGNQREVAEVVQRRGLTTRQTQTLVEGFLAAPSDDVRAALLASVRGTRPAEEGTAARRPRSPAEWLMCEASELRRRCGRLQGRLVGGPLPDDDAALVEGLRALVPALTGVLNALSKALPRRQAA